MNSRLTYAQETEDHTAELPEAHGGIRVKVDALGVCVGGVGALASSALVGGFICDVSMLSVSPVPRDVSSSPFHALYRF